MYELSVHEIEGVNGGIALILAFDGALWGLGYIGALHY